METRGWFFKLPERYGEPTMHLAIAMALVNKGASLEELDRPEEAIEIYDHVVERYGDASEPALRAVVEHALHAREDIRGPAA